MGPNALYWLPPDPPPPAIRLWLMLVPHYFQVNVETVPLEFQINTGIKPMLRSFSVNYVASVSTRIKDKIGTERMSGQSCMW